MRVLFLVKDIKLLSKILKWKHIVSIFLLIMHNAFSIRCNSLYTFEHFMLIVAALDALGVK